MALHKQCTFVVQGAGMRASGNTLAWVECIFLHFLPCLPVHTFFNQPERHTLLCIHPVLRCLPAFVHISPVTQNALPSSLSVTMQAILVLKSYLLQCKEHGKGLPSVLLTLPPTALLSATLGQTVTDFALYYKSVCLSHLP